MLAVKLFRLHRQSNVPHRNALHGGQIQDLLKDPPLLTDGLPVLRTDSAAIAAQIQRRPVGKVHGHGQGLKEAVRLFPVMFTHLAVRLILVVPDQLLPNRVVHLDGQRREGHPVQSGLHAVELEGLSGVQAHAAVRELELVFGQSGMIQKEVAERLASPPGNKSYGILSVLLQAWYDIEYLFTVSEEVFLPPPKVKSAVIRMTRNSRTTLGCDETLFKRVVKTAFNQRRKTLRNSLSQILSKELMDDVAYNRRPEELSVEEFISLTRTVEEAKRAENESNGR